MPPLIRIEHVKKIYNAHKPDEFCALDDISLQIEAGEVAVFKGPSGSGKTTLLSLIGCMSRPTEGRIRIGEKDVVKLSERFLARTRQQTFGFIFQQFNLLRDVSVLENVLMPLYPQQVPISAMKNRGLELLRQLDMENKQNVKIRQLSGGEQQRVAIARALINDPDIIIADEPTAHLDSQLSADLVEILTAIHQSGRTILIATHDPQLFNHSLISSVFSMHSGRLTEGC